MFVWRTLIYIETTKISITFRWNIVVKVCIVICIIIMFKMHMDTK